MCCSASQGCGGGGLGPLCLQPTPTPPPTIPVILVPVPVLPTTYTCSAGLTICPNNTTPGALCCQYGCCPSNLSQCKCSDSDQCIPNCSVQPPPSSSFSNPTLSISGLDTINPFVGLKRYIIDLTVTGTNFDSRSGCSLYPRISGLRIRTQPSSFFLGPGSTSELIRATIPISKSLKKLGMLTFKASCGNGTTAQKDITLTTSGSQPSTGSSNLPINNSGVSSPSSNNSGVTPSQVVISVSGVPSGTTGLAIPVTIDTSVITLGSGFSSVSDGLVVTGFMSEGVGILTTGVSLPASFTITVPLIEVMPGSSTFSIGAVLDMIGGSIIPGASATKNISSVVVH